MLFQPKPPAKSPMLAAVLGFAFGAFGLFYVNRNLGVCWATFNVLGGIATAGIAAPIIWLACGFIGYAVASSHNEKYGYRNVL